jgi:uncharacterized protein YaaQ
MKLVMAIINSDDAHTVIKNLTKAGFQVTRLATTGGFLMVGNVTIIVGVDEEKVDEAIGIIRNYSKSRTQIVPASSVMGMGISTAFPLEVTVGGATVFVMDVEKFEKL